MNNVIGPLKAPLGRLKSIYGDDFFSRKGPLFADATGKEFGQCFSLLKQFVPELGNTNTQNWVQGESFFNLNGTPADAWGKPLYTFGSAIATFNEKGKVYRFDEDGRSTHGAIFLFNGFEEFNGKKVPGLYVIDQWVRKGFSGARFIKVQASKTRSDDARAFSVVMLRK